MRLPSRRVLSLRHALVVLACTAVGTAGCARQPPPAPAPAAPRALTILPQQGQNQGRQNKDKAECQNTASAQANSSETWAQIFTACMSGRGYGVQ